MSFLTGAGTYYSEAGSGWFLAPSLVTLAHHIDAHWPALVCGGTKGNAEHQAQGYASDHNPFVIDPASGLGVVRAMDVSGPTDQLLLLRMRIYSMGSGHDLRVWPYGFLKGPDSQGTPWALGEHGFNDQPGDEGHLHISVTQVDGYNPSPQGFVPAIMSTDPWPVGTPTTPETDNDMGTIDNTDYNKAVIRQAFLGAMKGAGGDEGTSVYGASNPVNVVQWIADGRGALTEGIAGLAAQNAQILAAVNNGNTQTSDALVTLANAIHQIESPNITVNEAALANSISASLLTALPAGVITALGNQLLKGATA